ncbi:MAG: PTS transporter subunit EIIC [Anaerorhabdus sp.]
MGKYAEFSRKTVEAVGGIENITQVTHCATRLRINYKAKSLVDDEALKNLPDCAGIVNKEHQIQCIIGPKVSDCFFEFMEVSGWKADGASTEIIAEDETGPKDAKYWVTKFGNFVAPIFMPIIPALVVGGMILAVRVLLINYFGVSMDSGTAEFMTNIFQAGFNFLPIYIGYSYSKQLKMEPILGMFLAATLVTPKFTSGVVTDFLGIPIPQVSYYSTIIPVILGVTFMYFVYKFVKKIMPEALTFFLTPLLTMIVAVPVTMIILGPLGNMMSGAVASGAVWLTDTLGFIAQPILSMIYPYMVMFGMDKALSPVGLELIANLGYNSVTATMGFVSNLAVGATALAVAFQIKDNAGQRGLLSSFGITALCGVTEPAFYGGLILRPKALIGTAIGAGCGGLFAGLFGLRIFVPWACPGLLTFLSFINPETGSLYYVVIGAITAVITIAVSFIATTIIMKRDALKV